MFFFSWPGTRHKKIIFDSLFDYNVVAAINGHMEKKSKKYIVLFCSVQIIIFQIILFLRTNFISVMQHFFLVLTICLASFSLQILFEYFAQKYFFSRNFVCCIENQKKSSRGTNYFVYSHLIGSGRYFFKCLAYA